jgi:hypothetical protein
LKIESFLVIQLMNFDVTVTGCRFPVAGAKNIENPIICKEIEIQAPGNWQLVTGNYVS